MLIYLAVMIFITAMIKINLVQLALSPAARFITSPFNPIEDLSKVYSNVEIGYLANGVFIAILLFITQIYMERAMKWLSGRITIRKVFFSGVFASYITAAIYWISTGQPSTGTSIIGFGVLMFLTFSLILDAAYYFRSKRIIKAYVYFVAALVAGIMAYSFTTIEIHLIGGGLFIGLMLYKIPVKTQKRRVNKTGKKKG